MVIVEVYNQNAVFVRMKERIESGVDELGLYEISRNRLIEMFERYSTTQVFSRSLLMDDFHISSDKAGDLINILKKRSM